MRFGHTIIYVKNVEESISFYENAFGLKKAFLHETGQYGELDTGETRLAFASEGLADLNGVKIVNNRLDSNKSAGIEIALVTEDVIDAYHHAIAVGAVDVHAPTEKPWGQTIAYVRDLNGVLVEICSPL